MRSSSRNVASGARHVVRAITVVASGWAMLACRDEIAAPNARPALAPAGAVADRVDAEAVQCTSGNGGITLPAGFCAAVVADQVGAARHVAVAPNGDVYVAIGDTLRPGVLVLRDADGDGRAEQRQYFGESNANGVALSTEYLYVAYRDHIVRYRLTAGAAVPTGAPQLIVSGLPSSGDHFRKNVQLDGRGSMFVNIGSASNACQVQNRVLHSPGVDPCPELPVRAGIWRFSAVVPNQTLANGVRYATGYRNTEALRYDAARAVLYGLPHGRDMLNDNWPELYTVQQGADLPSEEFHQIAQGDDAGWPYCYHDWQKNLTVLAPEYGGNGTIVGRCAGKKAPLLAFPGHWAPNDVLIHRSLSFPSRYYAGAFVAFHGGHDRTPLPNEGYNVVFVPLREGRPTGTWEVFADGFTGGGTPLPANAAHRPMGLATAPDGSLYVTDDKGGRVWRIVYVGR